jgi:hypothetical protein
MSSLLPPTSSPRRSITFSRKVDIRCRYPFLPNPPSPKVSIAIHTIKNLRHFRHLSRVIATRRTTSKLSSPSSSHVCFWSIERNRDNLREEHSHHPHAPHPYQSHNRASWPTTGTNPATSLSGNSRLFATGSIFYLPEEPFIAFIDEPRSVRAPVEFSRVLNWRLLAYLAPRVLARSEDLHCLCCTRVPFS